jgi:hypothetical protein
MSKKEKINVKGVEIILFLNPSNSIGLKLRLAASIILTHWFTC